MDDIAFVAMVQLGAAHRGNLVPREFIVEAVERIRAGKEKGVVFYPSGDPPITDVLDIAERLREEHMIRH